MLNLEPIPAFEDNYIWAVHDGRYALFVDPGEAAPILTWLTDRRMQPAAILVTHHHRDHCGGLTEILSHHPGIPVFGPGHDRIPGVDRPVSEGTRCAIPELALDFETWAIPGHTPGHVAYLGHGLLFCGDTLFSCGCGKVFGSTPEHLHASLLRLAGLPDATQVCCAHEYTLDNIRFALTLDPDNLSLSAWRTTAQAMRQAGHPTLPTRMGDERAYNPFLRCHEPSIRQRLAGAHHEQLDDTAIFKAMRELKDRFG